MESPFRYFNSSPEVIRLVVMMYVKYRRGDGPMRPLTPDKCANYFTAAGLTLTDQEIL